jgi:hypothetical protein
MSSHRFESQHTPVPAASPYRALTSVRHDRPRAHCRSFVHTLPVSQGQLSVHAAVGVIVRSGQTVEHSAVSHCCLHAKQSAHCPSVAHALCGMQLGSGSVTQPAG